MARRRSTRRRHTKRNYRRRRSSFTANARRMMRNIFGADIGNDVITPVLGGAAGFLAARAIGNYAATKGTLPLIGADPRMGKLAAAIVGVPLTFALAAKFPLVARNSGAIVLGLGLAAADAYLRGTSVYDWGTPALVASAPTPAPAPVATSGMGDYYNTGMGTLYAAAGLGTGVDVSHAGAPYKGMLGLGDLLASDPANQSHVETALDAMESGSSGGSTSDSVQAISTVTPTDLAMKAGFRPQVKRVTETFADGDKGYAGGLFARQLFSGMMGG